MSRHTLHFASYKEPNDIFESVKSGKKTLETRPVNPNKNFQVGDELIMVSLETKEKLTKRVKRVTEYQTVAQMAENEEFGKIVPGLKTSKELIDTFEDFKKKWGREYARKVEKNGIVVLELE